MILTHPVLSIWSLVLGMRLIIVTKVLYYVRMLDIALHAAHMIQYKISLRVNSKFLFTYYIWDTINRGNLCEIKCTIFLADRNILVTVRACVSSRQINEYCNYGDSFPHSNIECYFCKENACNNNELFSPASKWRLGFIAIILSRML